MNLNQIHKKLKRGYAFAPAESAVLGKIADRYYYLNSFETFSFQNTLFCYFKVSTNPRSSLKRMKDLIYEIELQEIIFHYYPYMAMISPSLTYIKRCHAPLIKMTILNYNKKYNTFIFE